MGRPTPHFKCIPLGVRGGLDESNLPAFLVAPITSHSYICLDAGTLLAGLKIACSNGCFNDISRQDDSELSPEGYILHHHIRSYLITHPYLDHVQGLINISPEDIEKRVYGLPDVLEDIQNHMFNWKSWPNLCDRGVSPLIEKYRYVPLSPGKFTPIEGTTMEVEVLPLSHGKHTESSAFLVKSGDHYILYMGDTGPDTIENSTRTQKLWKRIAPIIHQKKLHAIYIEASYPDERPDDMLYSHLTPAWIMEALQRLASIVDERNSQQVLQGLTVVIIHMKPDLKKGAVVEEVIEEQLLRRNKLGLDLIFPQQGGRFEI